MPERCASASKARNSDDRKAKTASGGRPALHSVKPAMSPKQIVTAGNVSAMVFTSVKWLLERRAAARALAASMPTHFCSRLSARGDPGAAASSVGEGARSTMAAFIMRARTDFGKTSSTMRVVAATRRTRKTLRLRTLQS